MLHRRVAPCRLETLDDIRQDPRPLQVGAEQPAAEAIENDRLGSRDDLVGDAAQLGSAAKSANWREYDCIDELL